MKNNPVSAIEECGILPECVCNLELPHHTTHAHRLPRQEMPVLHFPEERFVTDEKAQRLEDLLTDFTRTREEDLKLKEKFEKRAEQLLKELAEAEKDKTADLWLPKVESPIEDDGGRLKYELEQSRFQLAELRNQLHSLKRELALYRKLVRQEVGCDYDLHQLLADKNWKGRAEEIERLKSEIAELEAKAYEHKYLRNPITVPQYNPRFPRIEDLIPKQQVEYLRREIIRRKENSEEGQMSAILQEYGDLALMYKANSTHNKILAEELRSLKEQLQYHETKAKEDLNLIKDLTSHQLQMRKMLDREAHLSELVSKKEQDQIDPQVENEIDVTKYKTLWEVSEYKKQALLEMVRLLTERLDDVMKKTEEAEKHCLDNQEKQKELEDQIKAEKEAAQAPAKKGKKAKGQPKQAKGKTTSVAEQLEAVKEENNFLKSFLRTSIETKEEDLNLYKFTMNSIRSQYLEAMEKIKLAEQNAKSPKTV